MGERPMKRAAPADEVRVDRDGRVLRVLLNRPERHNALSRPVLALLRTVFLEHAGDEGLACAVITGAGDRYFAAGGDLHDLSSVRTAEDTGRMADEARDALDAVRDFPVPVVALVNGDAIGGGAELALACDLRVLREGTNLGFVQGRLGITSGWGGGTDLCAVAGPARALRMTARGELVPAATALAWGLADAVVPADASEAGLNDFLAPMLAHSRAVLCGFKAQARAARRGETYDAQRALERASFVGTWTSDEHWAAVERLLKRARR
jgi:enoyl-CoA hydratase/carnithine racemase